MALDDLPSRLADPDPRRPFACFTFDDGYRDNREHAFPILARHGVPHTLYVPTDYPDGRGDLWWLVLEAAIRVLDRVAVTLDGVTTDQRTRTTAEKERAYDTIYWQLRALPESEARAIVAGLAREAFLDTRRLCSDLIMSWDEIREAARDPLLTIGAHTCRHMALRKLGEAEARREMVESRARIEAETGRPCRHFSYPYGCEQAAGAREFRLARELGFTTAVTTRKGLVAPDHRSALTAIPRLSLNGDFQDARYIDVMLSGVPFAMWNAARRVLSPQIA
jgi:peptidoglycan/xylan/chitin deacetylase (PgdA/CDA1 family)